MKTLNSNANEFKMRNKNFPALPGSPIQMQTVSSTQSSMVDSNEQSTTNIGSGVLNDNNMDQYIHFNSRHFSRTT
jgi:hypothetical protein